MNKFRYLLPVLGVMAVGSVFGQESGGGGFDPTSFLSTAQTTVTAIVTGLGALLVAALGIYLAFVGYRKVREALNKA